MWSCLIRVTIEAEKKYSITVPVVARLIHLTAPTWPSHRPWDFRPSLEHCSGLCCQHDSRKSCVFVRSKLNFSLYKATLSSNLDLAGLFIPIVTPLNLTNLAFGKEQRQVDLKANKSTRYEYQTVLKILPHVLYVALASEKLTKFHQKTS